MILYLKDIYKIIIECRYIITCVNLMCKSHVIIEVY